MRVDGIPDLVAVANDMASGSCTFGFGVKVGFVEVAVPCSGLSGELAFANHSLNWAIGSGLTALGPNGAVRYWLWLSILSVEGGGMSKFMAAGLDS
jgi:hypothetical protein